MRSDLYLRNQERSQNNLSDSSIEDDKESNEPDCEENRETSHTTITTNHFF
jgi:hypothetical protein